MRLRSPSLEVGPRRERVSLRFDLATTCYTHCKKNFKKVRIFGLHKNPGCYIDVVEQASGEEQSPVGSGPDVGVAEPELVVSSEQGKPRCI
jgi:hypothetical protein